MTETKKKTKHSRFTWGTALVAFFAAVTAVGDGVRSCNEREADRDQASRESTDRVKVDTNIQDTSTTAFEDLYTRIDALEAIVEGQDRDLFELRVDVAASERVLQMYVNTSAESQGMATLEALQEEAQEENLVVDLAPTDALLATSAPRPEDADLVVRSVATRVAKNRTAMRATPRPAFDFEPPQPQYQQVQRIPELTTK